MKNSVASFSASVKKISPLPRPAAALKARVAVYDSLLAPPQVTFVEAMSIKDFLNALSVKTYEAVKGQGAMVPFVVLREIIENLIHAEFKEPVISILEGGRKICVSDQGNGIADKEKALQPGFTTAMKWQKAFIRGVGSGLPVAKEIMLSSGGKIKIEDNLCHGTVVTLCLEKSAGENHTAEREEPTHADKAEIFSRELARALADTASLGAENKESGIPTLSENGLSLSEREKKALLVLAELGQAGPSQLAKELHMSIPTAHRELAFLELYGLARKVRGGKRTLSEKGTGLLEKIFRGQDGA